MGVDGVGGILMRAFLPSMAKSQLQGRNISRHFITSTLLLHARGRSTINPLRFSPDLTNKNHTESWGPFGPHEHLPVCLQIAAIWHQMSFNSYLIYQQPNPVTGKERSNWVYILVFKVFSCSKKIFLRLQLVFFFIKQPFRIIRKVQKDKYMYFRTLYQNRTELKSKY